MAKLIPAVALISVLLFIIANASFAYRTTITTVEVDDTNTQERCFRDLRGKEFRACQMYLSQSSSRRSTDGEVLEMPGEKDQQERHQLQECCNELKQVRDECQCEALQVAVEKQIESEQQMQREQYQEVMQKARSIPSSCGLPEQCQIRTFFF
ncbi:2S albumin precursor, putative [Ricinus communis]|uniref:2S albumin, putative n=1 Tax=Ricinus communis TaxID=3988 RepID=B9SA28_RICCO|nr:2S albumin precursor, putative [Ricinus communis]|eukprot:XP_002522847.1 2S albumin-like [Ricinus communis]